MQVPYEGCHIYDLEQMYERLLRSRHLEMHSRRPYLNLGKCAGDVCRVPLDRLIHGGQVDLLKAGPPCPPWSAQGSRKGQQDKRAPVFERILEWIVVLIAHNGLVMVCLENVGGVLKRWGGKDSFFDKVIFIMRKLIPEFNWCVDALLLGIGHDFRYFAPPPLKNSFR